MENILSKLILVNDTELSEKLFAYLKAEGVQVSDVSDNRTLENNAKHFKHATQSKVSKKPNIIRAGEVEMNLSTRQIRCAEQLLELTSTEYNILKLLVDSAGFVVTKELLSLHGLGKKMQPHDRSLDMHISNLRSKLASYSSRETLIVTIRGVGYQFIENQ
jgi:DNA-binding response OmpR family regulator